LISFVRRLGYSRRFVLATLVFGALVAPSSAVAGPAVSTTSPFSYAGTNSCTGEAFTGTGTLHLLMSDNLSASGVVQHHINSRLDGLKAVTLTGKNYVVQDTFNDELVFDSDGAPAEETFDVTAHFIRVGEDGTLVLGDDFYEYLRTHITANANGMVTTFSVKTNDMPCQ